MGGWRLVQRRFWTSRKFLFFSSADSFWSDWLNDLLAYDLTSSSDHLTIGIRGGGRNHVWEMRRKIRHDEGMDGWRRSWRWETREDLISLFFFGHYYLSWAEHLLDQRTIRVKSHFFFFSLSSDHFMVNRPSLSFFPCLSAHSFILKDVRVPLLHFQHSGLTELQRMSQKQQQKKMKWNEMCV